MADVVNAAPVKEKGGYTGTGLGLLGHCILWSLLTIITLGIGYPWVLCAQIRYILGKTKVDGRTLSFDGKGGQLIGKWIVWLLLCIITIGIYSFFLPKKVLQWVASHTSIEGGTGKGSWEGGAFMLFVHLLAMDLITVFTLGLLFPVGLNLVITYVVEHMVIGGEKVSFGGSGLGLLGHWIVWWILSIITLGIYVFWAMTHMVDWVAENAHIG